MMHRFKQMRSGRTFRTGLVFAALSAPVLMAALPASAQQNSEQNAPPITLDLRQVSLQAAITALTQSAGLNNIVIEPVAGRSFQPVNVKLVDKTLSQALTAIAKSAGGILTQEDGIYYLRPRGDNDDVTTPAAPAPKPASSVAADASDESRPRRRSSRDTQLVRISLNYLVPSDFVKSLDDPMFLAIARDDSMFQKHIPAAPYAAGNGVLSTQPVNAGSNNNTLGGVSKPGVTQTGQSNPIGGNIGSSGRDDDAFTQAQFGGGQVGGQFGGGQTGNQFGGQGQGRNGQNGQNRVSLKPEGINNIVSNDADNSLLVEYTDIDDLNRLREIVRLLDVAPRQVQIKAEFVNVTVADADSFGISWRFQPAGNLDVQLPPQSGASGTPSLLLAYASGNAVANLLAEVTHNTANILQAPMISTTNNKAASISIDNIISVAQTVTIPSLNGQVVTATQQIPVDASNGLYVLPHINGDNSISLALQPQLQTVSLRGDGGYSSTNESLTTYRRVANGETMVLGGFINKTDSFAVQKVPLLSDLPIIGALFTQRDHSVSGGEVLVFVTPTIIEDRAQGVVGATANSTGGPAPTP